MQKLYRSYRQLLAGVKQNTYLALFHVSMYRIECKAATKPNKRNANEKKLKTFMGKTEKTYILEGWVSVEKVDEVTETILKVSDRSSIVEVIENDEHEEKEKPSTLLKNPKTLESYETLTKSFGIPSYGEIDPTILMSMTFPIFFGLMFGDIGHGLLLLIVSILGLYAKKKNVDLGEIGNYIIEGAPLLLVCSVFSILCGFLYGEFFGFAIYGAKWYYNGVGKALMPFRWLLVWICKFFDFDEGVIRLTSRELCEKYHLEYIASPIDPEHGPVWFSPFHEPWMLFVLSIIIGVIHLSIGLLLNIINKFKREEYLEGILVTEAWLWFYLGLMWAVFHNGIVFTEWFKGITFQKPLKLVLHPTFLLIILPLIVMLAGRVIVEGAFEGGLDVLESLIASISNTISYARILALSMAHEGFAKAFISLDGVNPDAGFIFQLNPVFIISFLIGTLFIMVLEGLLSFIHTLRLHWVEWFLKFYEGDGIEFQPFRLGGLSNAES
ncbi:MAG: V-type ATP synthase subunit I [Candidatus Baldrarchaeia archaeon]